MRVRPSDEQSLSEKSIRRLDAYWGRLECVYGRDSATYEKGFTLGVREIRLENIQSVGTVHNLVRSAMEATRL